jgi:replication factor C subunit 1
MGFASSVAPCLLVKGSSFYPRFPEWLGKNSSQRKAKRLIRELKKVMGSHAQASRLEIQNDYVKLILLVILKYMKRGKDYVHVAIDFMQALGLTTEHLKEHLMTLCMDPKTVEAFDALDSQLKAAFTREYNKQHKDDVTKVAGGKKGKKGKAATAANEDEEDEAEEPGEEAELLTEEQ